MFLTYSGQKNLLSYIDVSYREVSSMTTYKESGVDINAGENLVQRIKKYRFVLPTAATY